MILKIKLVLCRMCAHLEDVELEVKANRLFQLFTELPDDWLELQEQREQLQEDQKDGKDAQPALVIGRHYIT